MYHIIKVDCVDLNVNVLISISSDEILMSRDVIYRPQIRLTHHYSYPQVYSKLNNAFVLVIN